MRAGQVADLRDAGNDLGRESRTQTVVETVANTSVRI